MKTNHLPPPPLRENRGKTPPPASMDHPPTAAEAGPVLACRFRAIVVATRQWACAVLAALALPTAQAVESAPPRLEWAGRATNGAARLNLRGTTPAVFALEATADFRTWTPVATNVLFQGQAAFVDPSAGAYARRFYRARNTGEPPYVPGEVLVRWGINASATSVEAASQTALLQRIGVIMTSAMQADGESGIYRARTSLSVLEAVRLLTTNAAVEIAEPNWIVTHQVVANDPKFIDGSLWGMYGDASSPANVFGSQAAEAWGEGYVGSRSVCVGVIDEGMQITHPDLAANIWTNPGEIPGNGVDDDGNGYVDDVHGWDFYHNDNTVFDGSAQDPVEDAHGTHVAGTIGAVGGNSLGVAGVNWNITLMPAKFIGPFGGFLSDAIRSVDYFTDLKRRTGLNIVALNNSWGGGGYSKLLHAAIIRAAKTNILFIAAAGNNYANNDLRPFYPACYNTTIAADTEPPAAYNSVIAVTALDRFGAKPLWANQGAQTVHLGAPGVGVVSTVPWLDYASYDGTSMAAPHVTGAAALYASTRPSASAAQIRQALLGSVLPTASLAGKTTTGGRLNLSCIIDSLVAPSSLTAEATSSTSVTVRWNFGATNATTFRVERSTDGISFNFLGSVLGNVRQYFDNGLAPRTAYWYRVQAVNNCNSSAFAGPVSVTTPEPPRPPAPTNLTGTAGADSCITLRWNYGTTNPATFRIEGSTDGTTFRFLGSVTGNARQYSDCGVAPSSRYWYRVQADNNGNSSVFAGPVDITTAPPPAPAAPTQLAVTAATGTQLNLTWEDVATNESEYRVERAPFGGTFQPLVTLPANATFFADTGANAGVCYTYRVTACNGGGCNSGTVTFQPTLPTPPGQLTVVAASGNRLKVTWTDLATSELEYRLERAACGGTFQLLTTLPANSTSFADTGANAGSCYTYRVSACNAAGCTPATATFQPTPPFAPGQLTVGAASGSQLNLTWEDLATNELEYRVERAACGGTFQLLTTLPADSTSFADTGANAGLCYTYRVSACNAAGCVEATAAFQPSSPVAPGQITVVAASGSQLNLTWQDLANNELEYRVERAACGGALQFLASLPADSTSFVDTGVDAGVCYTYQVTACNAGGCTGATTTFQPTPPDAPAVCLVAIGRYLQASWIDNAWNEMGYKVEFRRAGGFQIITYTRPANSTSLLIGPVPSGSVYSCEVWAFNEGGDSGHQPAGPVEVEKPSPSGVQASANGSSIGVTWSENCPDEIGFEVLRYRDAALSSTFTVGADVTSFTDTGLPTGHYRYEVRAIYFAGNSASAASGEVTVLPAKAMLVSPPNNATGVHRPTTFDWDDVPGATAYRLIVDYQPNDGSSSGRQRIVDVTVTSTTYISQDLGPGRNYYWKVRAIRGSDLGPWSDEWHFATRTN